MMHEHVIDRNHTNDPDLVGPTRSRHQVAHHDTTEVLQRQAEPWAGHGELWGRGPDNSHNTYHYMVNVMVCLIGPFSSLCRHIVAVAGN